MSKLCPRFNNMYGIKKILEMDLDGKQGIRSTNNDRVYAITGTERKGKSNLLLGMFDYWYTQLLKVTDYGDEYIKYFAANKAEFVHGLASAPKYFMVDHDEALKDLYAREAISSFNKDLNKAYFVIGGKNLWTGLACVSILDLDPNFRKRRIHGIFHVYSRGKVAFYSKKKLGKLIPALMRMSINNARPDPKYARDEYGKLIRPDFTDTYPIYEGPLLKKYLERKNKNMDGTVKELVEKYGSEDLDNRPVWQQIMPEVQAMMATGKMTKRQIAEKLGCSPKTVGQSVNAIRKNNPNLGAVN